MRRSTEPGWSTSPRTASGLECTGPVEKVEEFIDAMKTFGDIDVTRSGIVAVSMESRKLRLAPPVHAGVNGLEERPGC